MKDGLWQVNKYDKCAGFIVQNGKVILCAPVLIKKFSFWIRYAKWICE